MSLHPTQQQTDQGDGEVLLADQPAAPGMAATQIVYEYSISRETARGWIGSTDTTRARAAVASDLSYVHELHDSEFPATYATAAQLISDPRLFTFVVERDGAPIGYASGHVDADGTGHLDFMAVHPSARGVGDGAVLLAATVREVFERASMDVLRLRVLASRTPAIRFYESRGFTRTATFPA